MSELPNEHDCIDGVCQHTQHDNKRFCIACGEWDYETYISDLEAQLDAVRPYLTHAENCTLGRRRWNKGHYDILPCDCGLDELRREGDT